MGNYPPGLIGLACSDNARYSDFLPAIMGLQKPPGTAFMKAGGLGPAQPLNVIAQEFMADRNSHLQWLFLVNDDNLPPPDAITRLLDRNVDVVTGFYLSKGQPFEPILFDTLIEAGEKGWLHLRFAMKQGSGQRGIIPITGCGDGCLMIRRHVIAAIPHPRWEYGNWVTDCCDHDMVFARKVQEAGFGLYCDLDVWVGHLGIMGVFPHRTDDGKWQVHLRQGERSIVMDVGGFGEIKGAK